MAWTADEIARQPMLDAAIRAQSRALLHGHADNPRAGSVFATQQRWLLGHIGFFLHFRRDPADRRTGIHAALFLDMVEKYKVASRNTADAFLREMLNYGLIQYVSGADDRRVRMMEPAEGPLTAIFGWAMAHLQTLDMLDGKGRLARFLSTENALARLQPEIALRLLTSKPIREPQDTFSLFTWLNNGGVVMDWLIAGIEPADTGAERIPTGVMSTAEMAGWLKLSRTHLTRKLREAERMGSLGWEGKRGHSRMWVSQAFRQEYVTAQALKLAIFDAAFEEAFGG